LSRTLLGVWVPEPLGFCTFPNEVELERFDRSPETSRIRIILPWLWSLSEFLRRPPAQSLLAPGHYLPGFLPSSRHDWRSPQFARVPDLVTFRPRVFSTSRRFTPPPAPRACFIPQPRPGFSRLGVGPDLQRASTRRRPQPPCRSDPSPRGLSLVSRSESADFEASFRRSIASLRFGFVRSVG